MCIAEPWAVERARRELSVVFSLCRTVADEEAWQWQETERPEILMLHCSLRRQFLESMGFMGADDEMINEMMYDCGMYGNVTEVVTVGTPRPAHT